MTSEAYHLADMYDAAALQKQVNWFDMSYRNAKTAGDKRAASNARARWRVYSAALAYRQTKEKGPRS
jgi:hypothetical protein